MFRYSPNPYSYRNQLEHAVKHNMATGEEKASLEAWKKYGVLVNRVEPEKPEWPEKPRV
ncbi:tail fiber assembly protein [Xenorhabdus bakwenae]|uniref:tail fiber assembly protein n=1 Tax=Xenorhabdus bakwenae TaxID=3026967 RepID=UPI003DA19F48